MEKAGTLWNIPKRHDLHREFALENGKLATFTAFLELAERARFNTDKRGRIIPDKCGEQVAAHMARLHSLTHEEVWTIYTDAAGKIMDCVRETSGDEGSASNPTNIIARKCILSGASAVILVHNHPTGPPAPSGHPLLGGDLGVFRDLYLMLKAIRVMLYDCVILGEGSYWSAKEDGTLDRVIKEIEVEEQKKAQPHKQQAQNMADLLRGN